MNMEQAIKIHKDAGKHFFDKNTMRFFGSKIESELYDDTFFITSESINGGFSSRDPDRKYTVRKFEDGFSEVVDIGEFQGYNSYADARAAMFNAMGSEM